MINYAIQYSKKLVFLFGITLIAMFNLKGQTFQFRNYDSNMGLPQNFIYCMEQGNDGYLWIGTGEGLVRYDGLKFTSYTTRDSLADDFIMSLLVAADNRIWIGHNNGDLSVYHKNKFTPIRIPETNSPVRDINHDRDGNIWIAIQNSGFARIDKYNNITTWFDTGSLGFTLFYSIFPLDNNNVLVGTSEGLMRLTLTNDGKIQSMERYSEIPSTIITSIKPRRGIQDEYWITTEDEGFFRFSPNSTKASHIIENNLCINFNLEYQNIQDIEEEEEGHILLATWGDGVIKLFFDASKQEYTESFNFSTVNGLSNNFVRSILSDKEGNYWFATYGGGVSALIDESFVFYNLSTIGFQDNKAHSVFHDNGNLWIGLENGLILTDPYCFTDFEYYDIEMGIPRDVVTGFFTDNNSTTWVSTGSNGLYFRKKGDSKFSNYYYTSLLTGKKINKITGKDNDIYLATIAGFYTINTETKQITHLTTENGLAHNNINFVYLDEEDNVWIGPKNSGISKIKHNNIEIHRIAETPIDVHDMLHDKEGNMWLATHGRGVIKYSEDTLSYIGVAEGLSKNFCYRIKLDNQNRLWINHFPGLSCVDLNTNDIRTFGYEQNLGADFYDSYLDKNGNIWFASSQGVVSYLPEKDFQNSVPPSLNFTSIKVSGIDYSISEEMTLPYPYKDKYKFRFDFIGISFKDPQGVTYQYQLQKRGDSSTPEWIDLGSVGFREYEYLPDGEYQLQIRASNADGVYNNVPLSFKINIAAPIWKKLWFYIILIVVIGYGVYLYIMFRERNLRQQKEALQREVESQTITLRIQKAEIERKNRDITDSINYAKRIQSSILPSSQLLEDQFKEAFIFFAPRDIVSGDFYWFHPLGNKFLFCAADCTGHGVPGAFMSMIGTTLLNDIVKRDKITSPAEILRSLDIEIKILLQNNIKDNARDGMDISIVEVDLITKKVRLASAKRPVYLFINGELNIYKGLRRSIGDYIIEDDSDFVNIEYDTKADDTIYLFSDGYSDQFGGEHGKKFMTANVKKMLENIHYKPMNVQVDTIKSNFYDWKGALEQVDDVVFMGVRL